MEREEKENIIPMRGAPFSFTDVFLSFEGQSGCCDVWLGFDVLIFSVDSLFSQCTDK